VQSCGANGNAAHRRWSRSGFGFASAPAMAVTGLPLLERAPLAGVNAAAGRPTTGPLLAAGAVARRLAAGTTVARPRRGSSASGIKQQALLDQVEGTPMPSSGRPKCPCVRTQPQRGRSVEAQSLLQTRPAGCGRSVAAITPRLELHDRTLSRSTAASPFLEATPLIKPTNLLALEQDIERCLIAAAPNQRARQRRPCAAEGPRATRSPGSCATPGGLAGAGGRNHPKTTGSASASPPR